MVQTHLREHGTTLTDLLASSPTRQALFAHAAVQSYLTRAAAEVPWDQHLPILEGGGTEAQIYEELKGVIPYRADHASAELFEAATRNDVLPFMAELLRRRHPGIYVSPLLDLYGVRHFLNFLSRGQTARPAGREADEETHKEMEKASTHQVLLFPMLKDSHMSSIVVLFDPSTQTPLAGFLVDSKTTDFDYYSYRFNLRNSYSYRLDKESIQQLGNLPKAHRDDDRDHLRDEDHLFIIKPDWQKLMMNKPIPFFDASHPLQTEGIDRNCVLYSFNFLNAVGQLVEAKKDVLAKLATRFKKSGADVAVGAEIAQFIRNESKAFLPQYYANDGTAKSPAEIRRYHLEQRWEMGAEYVREIARPAGFFSR